MGEYRHIIKYDKDSYIDDSLEQREHAEYWCGEMQTSPEWAFLDTHHAALAAKGSIRACKKCLSTVLQDLTDEYFIVEEN